MPDYIHFNESLTEAEESSVKADLLSFIHSVALGEFSEPEQVKALIPAIETIARLF